MTVPIPSQVTISPVFQDTVFLGNDGKPLVGGKIFTYEAGSNSAEQTTFNSSSGDTANTNPIVLDSSGRMTTQLWLADGYSYNLVLTQADGTTVLQTHDNILGVIGSYAGGGIGTVIWNPITVSPAYVSVDTFQLAGFFVVEFAVGNRVRFQYSDLSYGYGVVSSVMFTESVTQVQMVVDSVPYSSIVINVAWSSAVVTNFIVDAGAVGYTSVFSYAGPNVGTKIQQIENSIRAHANSYTANLSGGNYNVTTGVGYTSYTGMAIDVLFDVEGGTTINVDNIGQVSLVQFDATGALVSPSISAGFASRLIYNGFQMIVLENLPYNPPPPAPVSFAPTMGTVPTGGTFTVTAGGSGSIAVSVSCFAHALFGNFGQGTFTLLANGTVVTTGPVKFFEWDSRQGGCSTTLLGVVNPGVGVTTTFTVNYAGPGTASDYLNNWMAITA